MSCAMVAGGVRTQRRPARRCRRRQLKAQMRAMKAEAKAAAKAAPRRRAEPSRGAGARPTAAFAETDWSTPWWEDRQPTALAD